MSFPLNNLYLLLLLSAELSSDSRKLDCPDHPPPHLAINDRREAEVVKDLSAVPPHGDRAVFPQAFIVKPIHLGDLSAFMVATNQGDPIRVADLEGGGGQARSEYGREKLSIMLKPQLYTS